MTYLTVQEVAELARCEHKAVRRAISRGELRAFRGPKRIIVRESDAHEWAEARPVKASPSRPADAPRTRPRRSASSGSVARILQHEERAAS